MVSDTMRTYPCRHALGLAVPADGGHRGGRGGLHGGRGGLHGLGGPRGGHLGLICMMSGVWKLESAYL